MQQFAKRAISTSAKSFSRLEPPKHQITCICSSSLFQPGRLHPPASESHNALSHTFLRSFPSIRFTSTKTKAKMTDATNHPLSGLWQPTQLQKLHYGADSVKKHLLDCLPSENSKAFIITGSSLATKTPLVKQVESLLGAKHAGTFSKIGQHAPVADLDAATELVNKDSSIDTVISIGGGSPIDSAKAISHRLHDKSGKWLYHIAIPTTLSASECTMMAGYTEKDGVKTGVRGKELVPHVVLYDATFALHTPERLWLSTGLRAMDHAIELLYHPTASEMPARWMALQAAGSLFSGLSKYKSDPKDSDNITSLQLASFASLGYLGYNIKGGLGLSHALGYALGSPYNIPHGITSCLTLGHVVKLKAADPAAAEQIARLLPFIGESTSGDKKKDAERVGERVLGLVKDLGLDSDLRNYEVGKDQIPVITKRATGQESGDVYDAVEGLVKGLFV
ncbi:Dehydroquinate synthase-like protein [Phaeosphaeriaceae sp. SRC1lsM3a]|nr:Dehydroquinate synthase-like protein [Stagonospora sp. SRC1lsM3a]